MLFAAHHNTARHSAFSSEVDTGSREENALIQETRRVFPILWIGKRYRGAAFGRMLMRALRPSMLGFAVIAATLHFASARDGKDSDRDCKDNQECALSALRQGQIRPLSEVLAAARAQVPGEVIKVELDRDDGAWVYEIKILTPNGRRREVEIDAQTLTILKID